MKKYYLLTMTVLLLSACTEHEIIPFDDLGPSERVTPSTKDDMPWPLTEYMDTQIAPGDNFFMYCNGTYWNNTQLDADNLIKGLSETEMEDALKIMRANYKDPSCAKLESMLEQPVSNDELYAFLKPFYNRIDQIQSYEDAFALAGQLKAEGVQSIFNILISQRQVLKALVLTYNPNKLKRDYEPFLTDDHPDYVLNYTPSAAADDDDEDDNTDQELKDKAEQMVVKHILPAIGISKEYYANSNSFDKWLIMPLDELKAYMKLMVFRDFTNEGSSLINDLKDYLNDRAVIEHYITPQLKAEVQNMCEEVRQVFIQRIGSLQWMSSSTKARAIKKIERIKFFVGYPDKWMASSPDLSGCANAREALQTFYKANLQYQKAYLGMKAADDYFNYQFGSVSASLLSANCYYDLQDNVVSIYPPYMLPPYYEAGMHPAIKYGMLMAAIGHEITHSVDIDGSKFDENGEITTWWTVQDKMDYDKLQQQLIDLYNRLPVLPEFDPSICNNGEKTLGENIADLGGLEIAHDAFVNYCKNRGFKGKDLDEMERKFFQAYANSCRSKYGSNYYEELKDDEHAFNKERVNGVVMNVDRWYELYNVQWGHYLYLRPENRTHIW